LKSRSRTYILFSDEESDEIVPVCIPCVRKMVKAREKGKQLIPEANRKQWLRKRLQAGITFRDRPLL